MQKNRLGLLSERDTPFPRLWCGYDGRGSASLERCPNSVRKEQYNLASDITITAGDVSYYLLGQIVDRKFGLLFGVFQLGTFMNGPSQCISLADRAYNEWAHVGSAELEASLTKDVVAPDRIERDQYAIRRLIFFYPRVVAERAALKRLKRELAYDEGSSGRLMINSGLYQELQERFLYCLANFRSELIDQFARTKISAICRRRVPDREVIIDSQLAKAYMTRLDPQLSSDLMLVLKARNHFVLSNGIHLFDEAAAAFLKLSKAAVRFRSSYNNLSTGR
jgi:hypothetical protein